MGPPADPDGGAGARRRWTDPRAVVVAAAAVAVVAWLPFLHAPLSSDESGFLLVARQWGKGTSLYGDYWVDRPPLLVWLFSLAGALGPVHHSAVGSTDPAVKLLGAVAAGLSVVLAGALAAVVSPRARGPSMAALVAGTALLSTPTFGMPETNGELLAVPFVLSGVTCLVGSLRCRSARWALPLAAASGASAVAAALVKQNVLDVFVLAAVLAVVERRRAAQLWRRAVAFLGGSAVVGLAALVGAAARGTSPLALWRALVVFRFRAAAVIDSSASPATRDRLFALVVAFVGSGAAALLLVTVTALARSAYRRPGALPDASRAEVPASGLAWPAVAMIVWELFAVAVGGSYWHHYLTGLVPGLVLLGALAGPGTLGRRWRIVLAVCTAYVVLASAAAWAYAVAHPAVDTTDARVESYLRQHARRGDSLVVAFGHPDIVEGSGLSSPYPDLWSLPVRVRDPHLRRLGRVMAGPDAPRWMVVDGHSLDSWALHGPAAQRYLDRHYAQRAAYGTWHVWERDTATGSGDPGS